MGIMTTITSNNSPDPRLTAEKIKITCVESTLQAGKSHCDVKDGPVSSSSRDSDKTAERTSSQLCFGN